MKDPVFAYLQKRSMHRAWPWIAGNLRAAGLTQAVVIPVLAESADARTVVMTAHGAA